MKVIKKVSLLFITFMLAFTLKSVQATTVDTAWSEYKNLKDGTTTNYYVGEKNYIFNPALHSYLNYYLKATISTTSSNSSVVSVSSNSLTAKKAGSATITVSVTYNNEPVNKTFKINVKKASSNPSLESSVNDVKKIINVSDNKTQVLLANSELWTVDNSTFKLKTKAAGNVSDTVATNVYNKFTSADSKYKANIVATLTNNKKLTIKGNKNSKSVSDVKAISNTGFLKTNGDFYIYTVASDKKINCSKKASKVTSIVGDVFYIKDGKTYSVYTNKKVFNTKVTKVLGSLKGGYALTSGGDIYNYSYNSTKSSFTTNKIITKVKTLYDSYFYQTKDGKYKSMFLDGNYSPAIKKEVYVISSNSNSQQLALKTNNKLYLNGQEILTNVSDIYSVNNREVALIVRKDGSIWRIKLNGSASLTKIRSGKTSAKKISTPTNVKAKKSGSKNVKVSWSKVSGATKYTVYRATSKNGSYKKIGTTTSGSYTDKKTTKKKTYYYKVVANYSKSTYDSAKSSAVKIKVK